MLNTCVPSRAKWLASSPPSASMRSISIAHYPQTAQDALDDRETELRLPHRHVIDAPRSDRPVIAVRRVGGLDDRPFRHHRPARESRERLPQALLLDRRFLI